MKVNSSIYKGIQYVQINALPPDQKEKLLGTINRDLFIKILVDGKLTGLCLQFKDYELWFESVYMADAPSAKAAVNVLGDKSGAKRPVGVKDLSS